MRRLPRLLWAMSALAASYAFGAWICTQALQRRSTPSLLARAPVRERPAPRRAPREPAPYELTARLARQAMFGGSI